MKRLRTCGYSTNGSEAGPTLGVITNPDGSRSAAYGGLVSCGSVWSCPVCAAKIATRRADDLATVMRTVDDIGGSAFMLTLTMRHSRGHRLGLSREDRARRNVLEERRQDRELALSCGEEIDDRAAEADEIELHGIKQREGTWDALSYAWSRVTSGSVWKDDSERFGGLLGWARAVEVTWGEVNGWHVHLHVLLCFREQVSADMVAATVGAGMFARWRRALERKGYGASDEHGWDLRRAQLGDGDLADYFVKMAHEVTSGHRKEQRTTRGGRTPMQLLGDAVDTYEHDAVHRWWAWEAASEGRRQLTWSTGTRDLRALAGLGREATDEEIADEDQDADVRIGLTAESWDWIRHNRRETELLDRAEEAGLDSARSWLSELGLDSVEATNRAPARSHQWGLVR